MDKFVRLKLYDGVTKEYTERWFNVSHIRHIEPESNKVMLHGSHSPIVVSTESMEALMQEIRNDSATRLSLISIARELRSISSLLEERSAVPDEASSRDLTLWEKFKKGLGL